VARRAAAGCAALLAISLAGAALTAAPALALPEGRHYELVSPLYKGGYGVNGILAVAPDGESVAFSSLGVFAGTPGAPTLLEGGYLARRGASGWSTVSQSLPAGIAPAPVQGDFSATLGSALEVAIPEPNVGAKSANGGFENDVLVHRSDTPDTQANWEVAGMVLKNLDESAFQVEYRSASADLCHIVFLNGVLLPEAIGVLDPVYELASGCDGEQPSLRLVPVNNAGTAFACKAHDATFGRGGAYGGIEEVAEERGAGQNSFNAIAADGHEIFFTACAENAGQAPHQVYVRLDGSRTLEVSRPLEASKPFEGCVANGVPGEVPCAGAAGRASANYAGANEAGTQVYFTTAASLTSEDKDTRSDLYMARIECPGGGSECEVSEREVTEMVQVSHDPNVGEAAGVQGVVRVAPDGSRVYFVARGVLTSQPGPEGQLPIAGADNLYVYDAATGSTALIADLCSGPSLSGLAEDARCPSNLGSTDIETKALRDDHRIWTETDGSDFSQTAGADGRFLVFPSYGQLTADDTDTARDVYRYDAATGALERVSLGEAGSDANGNDSAFDANIALGYLGGRVLEQHEMGNRAISEDGSRIVFTANGPLSPAAVNGLVNAYEWHEVPGSSVGNVSLVSSGSDEEPVKDVVISASGRDIFFVTVQGLLASDADEANDVYDARLGGGFASPLAPRQPCSGDACQGPLTNPAPLLVPGSVSQAPGGNFAALPAVKAAVKPKVKSCKKGYVKKKGKCVKKPKSKQAGKSSRDRRAGR